MPLRVLQHQYVFDNRLAKCSECELQPQLGTMCLAQRPSNWNGLMVVGEGPSVNEGRLKMPFVGRTGQILDALLAQSGLKREETFVTNATLCVPPRHDGNLDEDFPHAVPSCRPRLLEEIAHYQPRVVVALGRAALLAMTGHDIQKTKREKLECRTCAGELTLAWYPCVGCKAQVPFRPSQPLFNCVACELPGGGMPNHPAAEAALSKRKMKCPECGGKKTREVIHNLFVTEHRIDFVAGAVFDGPELGLPMVKYVIPTYHPSRIMRKAETKAQKASSGQFLFSPALAHFQKAARLLERERSWNFGHKVIAQGPEQAFELKRWLDARIVTAPEGFYGPDYITVDLETDDKEPASVADIRCVGLGPVYVSNPYGDACQPIVVDTEGLGKDHPTVRLLGNLFRDPRVKKAGQNAILYDSQVLWLHWGIECANFSEDTLYAHMSIAPDEKHDLQHIALTYTDSPAWKPPKNKNGHQVWESKDQLHLYNARDVYNTSLSLEAMRREMASEQSEFVYRLDIAKAHVARGMDRAGMPVFEETYEALRKEAVTQKPVWLEKLREQLKDPAFNPNAPAQLAKALFGPGSFCGFVPTAFSKKTGAPSTRAEALFPFRKHPFVADLLEFRKWRGICSNYFGSPPDDLYEEDEDGENGVEDWVQTKGIRVWDDWRIRCRWNPIGAKTGRWSSSPNLTNWPEEMRAIISTRGLWAKGLRRVIVGADMPQAELRVISGLSGDDKLGELCVHSDEARKFDPKYDPHSYVASIAFPNYLELPEWAFKMDLTTQREKKFSPRKPLRDVCKCVHPDTLLHSGTYRTLREVLPPVSVETQGSLRHTPVCDGQGGFTEATAWWDPGEKASVHVLTRGGILTCSREHKLRLVDGSMREAGALTAGDELAQAVIPRIDYRKYPTVPVPGGTFRGIPSVQIQTSGAWAYLAGAFLGDGCVTGNSVVFAHGHVDKNDTAHGTPYAAWQGILAAAARDVGFDPLLRKTSVSLGNRSAARIFSALGLTTHRLAVGTATSDVSGARVLRVPEWVRAAGRDACLHFLGGLVDTDGSVDRRRGEIRICTKDAVFAGQIATIFAGLFGLEAVHVEASWNKTYARYYYRVGLTADAGMLLRPYMRHTGKAGRLRPNKLHLRRKRLCTVVHVLDAGMQPAVDIQVAAADHAYLQNNFVGSNSVIYGLNYGAGAAKVLETISTDPRYDGPTLSLDMVERIIAAIYTAFPKVRSYREKVIAASSQTGYVRDALINRRRVFPLLDVPPTEASNYAIQCLHPEERVLTANGYVKIGETGATSVSIGAVGRFASAVRIPKEPARIWKTLLSDGREIRTDGSHRFLRLSADAREWEWAAVETIQPGDRLATPPIAPQEFGSAVDEDLAYWTGYIIGNGHLACASGRGSQVHVTFGSRRGAETHDVYAARFSRFLRGQHQKPQCRPNMTSIGTTSHTLLDGLRDLGVDLSWRFDTKRVPEGIWRASLSARRAFLRGYMTADGTISANNSAHTPNKALLQDILLLLRTCGVQGRIRGPYAVDRKGHTAWRLNLATSTMRVLGYGGAPDVEHERIRFSQSSILAECDKAAFLDRFPRNPFNAGARANPSFSVLYKRLTSGGSTNPSTLYRMWRLADPDSRPVLYDNVSVESLHLTSEISPVYTMAVAEESHRYDSGGFISKNCTVASMMDLTIIELAHYLPQVDPSAFIISQVHDAIYIEADEAKAPMVEHLLAEAMSQKIRLVPDAMEMPFPVIAKSHTDWAALG